MHVIAAAWEIMWWKLGDVKKPGGAAHGILDRAAEYEDQRKITEPERVRVDKAKGPDAKGAKAAQPKVAYLSTWCPLSKVVVKRNIVLNVRDHAPWSIWPQLPPQSNGESRGADKPGYNPKRSFKIQVLDGSNEPVKDEDVKIFTTYEEGSGGHGHKNGDKALPQDKQGLFYWKGKNGNPLIAKTDEQGMITIDSLVASQVSGKFLVTAGVKTDMTVRDTVQLHVRVPGLVEFGTGDYWSLTGNASTEGQNHPRNHWCTQVMKDSLTKALKRFYEWTESEEGGGKGIKLAINDMSLEWAGVFDIYGNWNLNKDHSFHRVGLSVDIDNAALKEDDPKNPKEKKLTRRGQGLERFVKDSGGKMYDEGPIHFGYEKGN